MSICPFDLAENNQLIPFLRGFLFTRPNGPSVDQNRFMPARLKNGWSAGCMLIGFVAKLRGFLVTLPLVQAGN